jgi:hypothetical protein
LRLKCSASMVRAVSGTLYGLGGCVRGREGRNRGRERARERESERERERPGRDAVSLFLLLVFHFREREREGERERERDLGATPLKRAPAPSSATILLCFFNSISSQCPSI